MGGDTGVAPFEASPEGPQKEKPVDESDFATGFSLGGGLARGGALPRFVRCKTGLNR